jgi:hypothetical protein
MKKMKSLFCVALLSSVLVGNVFAGDSTTSGVLGFFDNFMNTVVVYLSGGSNCEVRQCQTCKPGGDDGNCKPD